MLISPIFRFISLSIHSQTPKIFASYFTTFSVAEKLYARLNINEGNIEKSLASLNVRLDSTSVKEVLRRCHPNQFQMGLRFFIWAGLQSDYRHSSYIYSEACRLFKINRHPEIVRDVIEAYKADGCLVSVKIIKVVLNLCKQARIADEALWVLRKMPEFNLLADSTVYNVVIRLFIEKGDMYMADKLMREMGLIDLYPDVVTYISMIKGFCNVAKLEDASRLLNVMREHGCVPNVVAYSTLLEGTFRFGNMETAMELLSEMEKEGGECSPNVVTYTSVIQTLCERGRTTEALAVLDRMQAQQCSPNRVTVSTLMKGLCAEGQVKEAYRLINKVVAGGGVSKSECYSSLVLSLISIKRFEEAEKLFKEMLATGLKPDSVACSLMVKQLCSEGRMLDAFCLYEDIERMEGLLAIDSDIYSILLVGLYQQNHYVEATKFAKLMLERRVSLKAPYVDKLFGHLGQSGDKELVLHLTRI